MNTEVNSAPRAAAVNAGQTNGGGGAAVLAAGIGCFAVAVFAILGDKSAFFHNFFIFSKPTGPLSGVSTSAIVVWLAVWRVLHASWRKRTVSLAGVNAIAFTLLLLSLLLTFPPIADLF